MSSLITRGTTLLSNLTVNVATKTTIGIQQTRNYNPEKYKNAWMLRDVNRRKLTIENAPARLRLVALKRNNILPKEIRDSAAEELQAFPSRGTIWQLTPRCVVTSRSHGSMKRWHVSRFIFREQVDYNKMSGMQRAMWG